MRIRRIAHASRTRIRQGVRRRDCAARARTTADRRRADERRPAVRGARSAWLARSRRRGDHRARHLAHRTRGLAAACVPRLDSGFGRTDQVVEGTRCQRHGRGDATPPPPYRRAGCDVRPDLQGQSTASQPRRRRRDAGGAGRRHYRRGGDRPCTARARRQRDRMAGRFARNARARNCTVGGRADDGRDRSPRLGWCRRPHVGAAGPHRPTCREGATDCDRWPGQPGAPRPRRPSHCRPACARVKVTQHSLRGSGAARAGHAHISSGPAHGSRREARMTGSISPALLVLEDGRTFEGESYGAPGETFGEAVFATGMTGYQETLTDPSYHKQVVVMTAPHVGNTGINDEDGESSRIWVSGYVVRDPARVPSNWRSRRSLDVELAAQGVVGISGIDTRALTRHLRERGAMRVGISTTDTDAEGLLRRVRATDPMEGADLASEVSTPQAYVVPAIGEKLFTVAALDLGIKTMTPHRMAQRGVEVHVLPAGSTIDDVLAVKPDGVFFSNGPGDPAATVGPVELLRQVLERRVPFFGICFGNQLLGRALGFDTYKLKYGHRGINQPVIDRTTGKVEITAHNHGFAVDAPLDGDIVTPYGRARVSHVCLNDDVVEGLECLDRPAFSVQYHPEAAAGPHDAAYLFDRFGDLMAGGR